MATLESFLSRSRVPTVPLLPHVIPIQAVKDPLDYPTITIKNKWVVAGTEHSETLTLPTVSSKKDPEQVLRVVVDFYRAIPQLHLTVARRRVKFAQVLGGELRNTFNTLLAAEADTEDGFNTAIRNWLSTIFPTSHTHPRAASTTHQPG